METVNGLATLALERIAALSDDDAKVSAFRVLIGSLNELANPPEGLGELLETVLVMGRRLTEPGPRARAFHDACRAIGASGLPLGARRDLLSRALDLGLASSEVAERVSAATAALEARLEVRYAERAEEVLDDLGAAALTLSADEERGVALLRIATMFARCGATEKALACLDGLPPGGRRALGLARVAAGCKAQGADEEAAALHRRAVQEVRGAPSTPERILAAHELLGYAVEAAGELGSEIALSTALAVVADLGAPEFERDALLGAIGALPRTTVEPASLRAVWAEIEAAIDRVAEPDERLRLRGRLAVALASLGEIAASLEMLSSVAQLVSRLEHAGICEPHLSLPIALPVVEILEILARPDYLPYELERFAAGAIDLLDTLRDTSGVSALLGDMTRLFANPGLHYSSRVALLDRVLAAAHRIDADDARAELVGHVANSLSTAGATERGDALFAGLIGGIGARRGRDIRLTRAVTLVRLGRSPEAHAEIAAAAAASEPTVADLESLATAMARCGFIGDMVGELHRIAPTDRDGPLARVADRLVEAAYLDPHLRELGLSSLAEGTDGAARITIECLLDQVRLLEGIGDASEIVARSLERTDGLPDRPAAVMFERQIVGALIERLRWAEGPFRLRIASEPRGPEFA